MLTKTLIFLAVTLLSTSALNAQPAKDEGWQVKQFDDGCTAHAPGSGPQIIFFLGRFGLWEVYIQRNDQAESLGEGQVTIYHNGRPLGEGAAKPYGHHKRASAGVLFGPDEIASLMKGGTVDLKTATFTRLIQLGNFARTVNLAERCVADVLEKQQVAATHTFTVFHTQLNLHEGPSREANIVGRLAENDVVRPVGKCLSVFPVGSGEVWCRFETGAGEGWLSMTGVWPVKAKVALPEKVAQWVDCFGPKECDGE